uniref:SJCHGC07123 protein n=1 Tax=Schistosoma japonicum TaxID=6182 RepID=Q5BRX2_SCHJA|nr:SJCHGC07123 protein [Schistosoma japonicum]
MRSKADNVQHTPTKMNGALHAKSPRNIFENEATAIDIQAPEHPARLEEDDINPHQVANSWGATDG